ncbi:transposase [Micromonospora chersina]|uniref:transposase n=1 Tax=Micromonospora chersina TaxID=47854 RepID=UPI00372224BC
MLTRRIDELEHRIADHLKVLAPEPLKLRGCAGLTAAKIIAETAGMIRFRNSVPIAMHVGTAPIPVWTGDRTRFRQNRGGNRQLNTALHRIVVPQLRVHPPTRTLVERRVTQDNSKMEAIPILRRHLADGVHQQLRHTTERAQPQTARHRRFTRSPVCMSSWSILLSKTSPPIDHRHADAGTDDLNF